MIRSEHARVLYAIEQMVSATAKEIFEKLHSLEYPHDPSNINASVKHLRDRELIVGHRWCPEGSNRPTSWYRLTLKGGDEITEFASWFDWEA